MEEEWRDIKQIKSSLKELETERNDIQLLCIKSELELSIENILKELDRLQKENTLAKETIKNHCSDMDKVNNILAKLQKENKKLISDNLEYQRIQDIFNERTYRKKYLEERRKEEPNLLYPDADEIYQRYYKLKKENEKLSYIISEIEQYTLDEQINEESVNYNEFIEVQIMALI